MKLHKQLFFIPLLVMPYACQRELSSNDPPLRPLIYTELPPNTEQNEQIQIEESQIIAPEDLGLALFHAIIEHQRKNYEELFITAQQLSALVKTPIDKAQKSTDEILKNSEPLWQLFKTELLAEEPIGGLSSKLKLSEFRIGKGRNLAGKIANPEEDTVAQHWGNELRIQLQNTDKYFIIRIPKIVNTQKGWRIAQRIELDVFLQIYLEAGMHLKNELMSSEHYPLPLEVGNYWKYEVIIPQLLESSTEVSTNHHDKDSVDTLEVVTSPSLTISINDIIRKDGYWIVSLEKKLNNNEEETIINDALLVTPKLIMQCTRDCKINADNISYILAYMTQQMPIYKFPLKNQNTWTLLSQKQQRYKIELKKLNDTTMTLPSGSFHNIYKITSSVEEGREEKFFVPGTGVVKRTIRTGTSFKTENLSSYRLIL